MKFYDFNALSKDQKLKVVWDTACHINSVKYIDSSFVLYRIEKFYIEIEYSSNENRIINIRSFKQGAHLAKYLDLIDINI